ncbi:MAG: T9SS type A sorting domain-containing protein [bacterium]|nr:T9SS type A sorting domain-containing protein [bacterium]
MKQHTMFLAAAMVLFASASAPAQLVASGDLVDHIDAIIADMPTTYDGGDYLQPASTSRAVWREIIDHILVGEYADAHTKALTRNYQVVLYTDTQSPNQTVHVLLERTPASTSRYWGTYLFCTTPARHHLVIQAPHPRYDSNTGYQCVRAYRSTGAAAYFVSGTHRCNGISYSPCDGTTYACTTGADSYRYSDQAHVVLSTFQITTEAILDQDPDALFIQPHGFAKGEDDPDLIISNGTRYMPSGTDYAVAMRDAFAAVDPSLTFKVAHVDLSWTRLLGTTNCQGRLINGGSDPCGTSALSATGKFVHIEQARPGLRDTPANWTKLAQAIALAVPDEVSSVPGDDGILRPGVRIIGNYANPFQGQTRVDFELGRGGPVRLEVFDLAGRRVAELTSENYGPGIHSQVWNARRLPSGTYFLRLQQGDRMVTHRCVLLK